VSISDQVQLASQNRQVHLVGRSAGHRRADEERQAPESIEGTGKSTSPRGRAAGAEKSVATWNRAERPGYVTSNNGDTFPGSRMRGERVMGNTKKKA